MEIKGRIVPLTLEAYLSVCDMDAEFQLFVIDDYKVFSDDSDKVSYRSKMGTFSVKYLLETLYSKYLNTQKFEVGLQRKGMIATITIDIRED